MHTQSTDIVPATNVRDLEKAQLVIGKLQAAIRRINTERKRVTERLEISEINRARLIEETRREKQADRKFDEWLARIESGRGTKWRGAKEFIHKLNNINKDFNEWAENWFENAQKRKSPRWHYAKKFANDLNHL